MIGGGGCGGAGCGGDVSAKGWQGPALLGQGEQGYQELQEAEGEAAATESQVG